MVEPTKLTASISLCAADALDDLFAAVYDVKNTIGQSGIFQKLRHSAIPRAARVRDGFIIIVLPRTSAFGIVQFGTISGKLNGAIDATTPTGKCSVRHSTPRLTSRTSFETSCGIEHANSVSSILLSTSAFASSHGLAVLLRNQCGQFVRVLFEQIAIAEKDLDTLLDRHLLPTTGAAFFAESTAVFNSSVVDIGTLDNCELPSRGDDIQTCELCLRCKI